MDTLPQLLDITQFPGTLSASSVLWGVALFITAVCVGYSLLLLYHAIRYGGGVLIITIGMVVYAAVAAVLLLGMFSSVAVLSI